MPHTPGCVAQSVMCLAADVSLTADPGVGSLISARSHTEKISTVILLPSAESFKKLLYYPVTAFALIGTLEL